MTGRQLKQYGRRMVMAAALAAIPLLGACGGSSSSGGGGGGGGGTTRAAWTIMLYVDADNNLWQDALLNLDQLEQLPNNTNVNLVCLMKCLRGFPSAGSTAPNARRFVIHHSSARNSYVSSMLASEGSGHATNLGNLDMGQVSTVQSFVSWCQTNYPADHYALDLWDHGSGWRPVGRAAGHVSRGILYSDTFSAYLHNEQMATALTASTKIDLLMMDACNMQMAEVAYAVRNVCDYVVAGEDVTPDEGYPYQTILAPLLADATRTPVQVATDIVQGYTTQAYANQTQSSLTQSVIRTSSLGALATAANTYADLLVAKDGSFHNAIATARAATQNYAGGDAADYEGMRDLVDFTQRVSSATGDAQLTTAGNAVATAVSAALVAEAHVDTNVNGAASDAGSHGLAVFLPNNTPATTSDAWSRLRASYLLQDWATPSGWAAWLDAFYGI